ncbi:MAG TPA: glycosyltransferase family 2 protein [Verrucomicrobiae bacterium]
MCKITSDQVSCVIPYAGAVKYIAEAVLSACAQKFGQVIIVNDGFPPAQLDAVAGLPDVRIIHLTQSVGCPNARNLGIKACATPYVVLLDHDDVLCAGYFKAISAWMADHQLRCAAATLKYIGENSRRVGAIASRHPDFFLPSGFLSEISLIMEVGYFPDSYSDDLLFFRAIRKATRLTTCPGAGVLYRIHPQAESSRNTKAWWAFNRLLPLHDQGARTLAEINGIAREFAAQGTIPPGLESRLCGGESAHVRFLSRSAYACWLNRDFSGVARYGFKLVRHMPELARLVRRKWGKK